MLSWGQLAWTFFTLLIYIGKLLSRKVMVIYLFPTAEDSGRYTVSNIEL